MKTIRVILGILIFVFFSIPLFPQRVDKESPLWYLYEKGVQAFRMGNLGESLTYVKRIQEEHGEIPEAVFLMGQIYEKEGEFQFARQYYERALELRKQFYVQEDVYQVQYRLASLYHAQKKYREYEKTLREIIYEHPESHAERYEKFRDALVRIVTTEGFETVLKLYRLKNDFATRANRELGIFYCKTGRSYQAVLHLTLSQVALASTLIEEQRYLDPTYQFTSLSELVERSYSRSYLRTFLQESGAWEGFYYLASSLYLHGVAGQAKILWELTAKYGEGELKQKSRQQLQNPQREPLIGL